MASEGIHSFTISSDRRAVSILGKKGPSFPLGRRAGEGRQDAEVRLLAVTTENGKEKRNHTWQIQKQLDQQHKNATMYICRRTGEGRGVGFAFDG